VEKREQSKRSDEMNYSRDQLRMMSDKTPAGSSSVRRDRGGSQGEVKSCTARGIVGSPQAAAMRLND
jgi:hypothetical protein